MARARVAEYRGLDPAAIEETIAALDAELAARPPALEGLRELLVLVDSGGGRALAITIFDDEAGLSSAAEALGRRAASQSGGVRTEVAVYDVALRRRSDAGPE